MWELGHMGRRTFTQGHSDLGFDFTVNYSDVNDLIDKIKSEESRIGEIRSDVYEAATSSLCHSEDWLSTEYYEGW